MCFAVSVENGVLKQGAFPAWGRDDLAARCKREISAGVEVTFPKLPEEACKL